MDRRASEITVMEGEWGDNRCSSDAGLDFDGRDGLGSRLESSLVALCQEKGEEEGCDQGCRAEDAAEENGGEMT